MLHVLHCLYHPMLGREGSCAWCYTVTTIPCWGDRNPMSDATLSPQSHVEERGILCLMLHCHHNPMLGRKGAYVWCCTVITIPWWGERDPMLDAKLPQPSHVGERGSLCLMLHCHHNLMLGREGAYVWCYTVTTIPCWGDREPVPDATLPQPSHVGERGILRLILHCHHNPLLGREGAYVRCYTVTIPWWGERDPMLDAKVLQPSHVGERGSLCLMLCCHNHPILGRDGSCAWCYTFTIIPCWG